MIAEAINAEHETCGVQVQLLLTILEQSVHFHLPYFVFLIVHQLSMNSFLMKYDRDKAVFNRLSFSPLS